MRSFMLLILAKAAGGIDSESEARLLGVAGQEIFEEQERSEESVDLEISWRVLEAQRHQWR